MVENKLLNKSSEFKMTHQATTSYVIIFWRVSCLSDGQTDTMCENNDHLFGRDLVGQYLEVCTCFTVLMKWFYNQKDICVINDPLCQSHSIAWKLFCCPWFCQVGPDRHTPRVKIVITATVVGYVDQFYVLQGWN